MLHEVLVKTFIWSYIYISFDLINLRFFPQILLILNVIVIKLHEAKYNTKEY